MHQIARAERMRAFYYRSKTVEENPAAVIVSYVVAVQSRLPGSLIEDIKVLEDRGLRIKYLSVMYERGGSPVELNFQQDLRHLEAPLNNGPLTREDRVLILATRRLLPPHQAQENVDTLTLQGPRKGAPVIWTERRSRLHLHWMKHPRRELGAPGGVFAPHLSGHLKREQTRNHHSSGDDFLSSTMAEMHEAWLAEGEEASAICTEPFFRCPINA